MVAKAPKPVPKLSENAKNLKPGKYRHYKGFEYEVLGVALHSETLEELVTYKALYGEKSLWVRPLSMFTEMTTLESGEVKPRFEYVN